MSTFILKLIVAVVPFLLLVGSIALVSGRRRCQQRRIARRRTCRPIQRALAMGTMLR